MNSKTSFLLFLAACALTTTAAQAACFDVSKHQPSHLSGHLSHRIFAGPPNFTDVQKGDTPEPGYVLKLPQPICLSGDEFADPANSFDEVQLVPSEGIESKMASFRDTDVDVDVVDPMPAITGHHHRPLVAWVKAISSGRDITESYGTAATTIEAFYAALHSGDGSLAASYVIPEKTKKGAYSSQSLTTFYSALAEPITLIDIHPIGADRYAVRYHFQNGKNTCDGAATIATVKRGDRNYIQSIIAKNGC